MLAVRAVEQSDVVAVLVLLESKDVALHAVSQALSQKVTGPSFASATCMSAPKRLDSTGECRSRAAATQESKRVCRVPVPPRA